MTINIKPEYRKSFGNMADPLPWYWGLVLGFLLVLIFGLMLHAVEHRDMCNDPATDSVVRQLQCN
jgi:hypothetical protein